MSFHTIHKAETDPSCVVCQRLAAIRSDCLRPHETDEEPWSAAGPEPISGGLAALLAGVCYGFVAGIVFALVLRSVWR